MPTRTGRPAQPVAGKPLDDALRVICEADPAPLAGVDRDLAAVVRKALEKEPARRYASAQELASDVGRYRAGFPVEAENPTLRYVARKFVSRNRAAVTAGAAGLVVALVAIGGLVWQFQVARRERALAEKRFEAARKLARELIQEVPRSLTNIPGTLETRKLMAEKATVYLEELARESGGDPRLQRDIGQAYGRVGHAQWSQNEPHLGNAPAAERAQRRRVAIFEALRSVGPGDPAVALDLINALTDLSYVVATLRNVEEARRLRERTESLARSLASRHPDNLDVRRTLGRVLFSRAVQFRGAESLARWNELASYYAQLLRERPDSAEEQRNLALVHKYRAEVRDDTGDLAGAVQDTERARELDEARLARAPQSRVVQMDLSFDYSNLGGYYFAAGQREKGLAHYAKAIAIREQLARSDPADSRTRERLSWLLAQTGSRLMQAGRYGEAAEHYRRSLREGGTTNPRALGNWSPADTYSALAEALAKLGKREEACAEARRAREWLAKAPPPTTEGQTRRRDGILKQPGCAS